MTTVLEDAATPARPGAPQLADAPAGSPAPLPGLRPLAEALRPLAEALGPDGALDVARATGRALDPTGWALAADDDSGPRFVRATDASWSRAFGDPAMGPDLYTAAVSGRSVYVGGDFTYSMGGMSTGTYNRIATWDGTGWRRLGAGLAGAVRAVVVVGSSVYVGGDFTSAGGDVPAAHLARWDGRRWHAVAGGVSDPESTYGTTVNALASDGRTLYVGGSFRRAGGTRAHSLAALTLATGEWTALGEGVHKGSPDSPGEVRALALVGATLHVGGSFDLAGSTPANSLASLDTTTGVWTSYPDPSGGGPDGVTDEGFRGTVNTLAADRATGTLYVGGSFTSAGGVRAWNLAALRDGRFAPVGDVALHGGKYAEVYALAVAGGRLYLGGSFTEVGGLAARNWVVRQGERWSVPGAGVDNVARALAPKGTGVVVLGDFVMSGEQRIHKGGVWTGTRWQTFGQGVTSTSFGDGEVRALLPDGAGAFVGGRFDEAGEHRVGSVARWTGRGWDRMAGGVRAAVGHGQVFALARIGTDLFVAGSFDTAGGVVARNIARWDGARWSPLGSGLDGDALAMTVIGGRLYVGGEFATAGGVYAGGLAQWDPATSAWSTVGHAPTYDHAIWALTSIGDRYLVVGGIFDGFNHGGRKIVESLYGMTMFDTAAELTDDVLSGYYLLEGVSRYGAAGWVRALHVVGGDLYVGGWFDVAGIMRADGSGRQGFAASNVAVWHFSTTGAWEPVGDTDQQVGALASVGTTLVAGGWFTTAGRAEAARVAALDPATGTWAPLASGIGHAGGDRGSSSVRALAQGAGSELWVGGSFSSAGGNPSANVALWTASTDEPTAGAGADGDASEMSAGSTGVGAETASPTPSTAPTETASAGDTSGSVSGSVSTDGLTG